MPLLILFLLFANRLHSWFFESGPEGDPQMPLVEISNITALVLHVQVGYQTHKTQVSLI